jgi:hypothetical protein
VITYGYNPSHLFYLWETVSEKGGVEIEKGRGGKDREKERRREGERIERNRKG